MNRPHFNKSIAELERAYERNGGDTALCQTILEELSYRTTLRSQNLKARIEATADTLARPRAEVRDRIQPQFPKKRHSSETMEAPAEPAVSEMKNPHVVVRSEPAITNDPENILRAWTALEVLSPQSYRREIDLAAGDKSRIAYFGNTDLPWELGERSRPKKRLYFELILGSLELAPAVDSLVMLYADNRPDRPSVTGFSPVASILLDKEGRPLEERSSFAISSFAWGAPIALQGDLRKLADWPEQEKMLLVPFQERLIRRDQGDEILPLTKTHIEDLFEYLINALNLHAFSVKEPYFALRRFEFFASKTLPEPGLLNSFFLEDLAMARNHASSGTLPKALKHYLNAETAPRKIDLLQADTALQHLLQPALTPLGRWPGNGRFPLALLQQAAINATTPSVMDTGILAVNGPPGTGKTTLLRDVVAARIIDRARVMSTYERPADAFFPTSQKLQRSGATITLHRLDERLKGFEMVVASSNNKAVENVSAELPALDAIAKDAPQLRYFKTISDNVLERETWGMIAAVLGKSSNRYMFSQKFWRDDESGLSTYLNHASGIPQVVPEPQASGPPIRRYRKIIDRETPPANAREAAVRWEKARRRFLQASRRSEENHIKLQDLHSQLARLVALGAEIDDLLGRLPDLEAAAGALETALSDAHARLELADAEMTAARQIRDDHFADRPGFLARLFGSRHFEVWSEEFSIMETRLENGVSAHAACENDVETLRLERDANGNLIEKLTKNLKFLRSEKSELHVKSAQTRNDLAVSVPDSAFFARTHEEIQTASVWFGESENKLRDDVFESAIHLHRAFIDGAADPLRQNLSIFMESFGTRSLGTPQKDALIADQWASFFLVVPIVSTTFASVHRMFSRLAPETLGWLLVDEAGQAAPQAAVGAMMRTKQSIVVGDPLQIEPVVTLPNSLTEQVCGFFGIDPLKYNAPEASVQTAADAASLYCARFPIGSGHRDVGAPLLVHRRCSSPMFDISNEVAYSNLMVQAKRAAPENPILGPSAWIDVAGKPGPDKWCADEATVLIDMLYKLRGSHVDPDLYIVTPFLIVQNNMRNELLHRHVLDQWVDHPDSWVREHVGTVHTVQGREAGIVFFVLGAQMSSQNGARSWAGGRPNIVNVAITRARNSLYVIGNRELWRSAGVFSVLDRYLPGMTV